MGEYPRYIKQRVATRPTISCASDRQGERTRPIRGAGGAQKGPRRECAQVHQRINDNTFGGQSTGWRSEWGHKSEWAGGGVGGGHQRDKKEKEEGTAARRVVCVGPVPPEGGQ